MQNLRKVAERQRMWLENAEIKPNIACDDGQKHGGTQAVYQCLSSGPNICICIQIPTHLRLSFKQILSICT